MLEQVFFFDKPLGPDTVCSRLHHAVDNVSRLAFLGWCYQSPEGLKPLGGHRVISIHMPLRVAGHLISITLSFHFIYNDFKDHSSWITTDAYTHI